MEEESHNSSTRSQSARRKRSISPEANDISSTAKKRSTSSTDTDMNEMTISNQTTEDITTTLSRASNTNDDIPTNVTEIFEEIDEKPTTKDTEDLGQEIDIESSSTPANSSLTITTTEVVEPMISNSAKEQAETSAPETTRPTATPAQKPTESAISTSTTTSSEAKTRTEPRTFNKGNRSSDSLTTSTLIEKDTPVDDESVSISATILETKPTATTTQTTSKKHHLGLTVPDKSSSVRQPFSDKFFFTNEAYETYSHDSFMTTIDSVTKKNKPGLALSLERPTSSSSSSSRTPSMQPAHQHHQQRPSYPHGTTSMAMAKPSSSTTPDNGKNNNPPTIHPASSSNILDSLLDSISKNDRPVMKPAHVPSDIEIAMQAADLPSTQSQE